MCSNPSLTSSWEPHETPLPALCGGGRIFLLEAGCSGGCVHHRIKRLVIAAATTFTTAGVTDPATAIAQSWAQNRQRVFGNADRFGADRTSGLAGATQE